MTVRTGKGERRKAQLAAAAADLVLREGPGALTHRRVAAAAGASLSATTYYFADLDELAAAAGRALVAAWVAHAEGVLAASDGPVADAAGRVVDAVLPPGDDEQVRAHYEHLLGAGRNVALAGAIADARAELDAVVARLVDRVGLRVPAAVAVALVDGAAVSALSEGRPVRTTARGLLAVVSG
ncbi:hypothetical protein [Cellulomonas fimi]|uniref:HTH tetR-type domain-containing protein n=1 Tax=Cellulomonas fimi (strain ATCC 484 / DSM 20113 / JCM 1341 / CCUG 24087 / LMG 16345 / NBRC 15513 / NCIMB 8980 / NCTC 7547 / NRS-133) TaxID=590998 RepID=F4H192_CELFA|nr:hypothetical protein [Cellulomonas fimi]AEE45063.1 hypothetical protein Celf_0926 [Cellulomonas fimi ATCC 484]NNH07962.1 TetR family transcriptional regulator [Cellulomonas fimi]VEH28126.1 putative DNA-binding transcriptional regulator [Cellulomonas fimi]